MEDDDEATNPTLSEERLELLGARGEERILADESLRREFANIEKRFY